METKIQFKGNDCYWQNHKLGTLFPSESLFQTVKRTRKNVFRLFGGGLGINEELLVLLKNLGVKYIVVPFCNKNLKTTVDKWLIEGVRSPYNSGKVDQQIILGLSKITLHDNEPPQRVIKAVEQPSLFEV
jgi:hypothetical protein